MFNENLKLASYITNVMNIIGITLVLAIISLGFFSQYSFASSSSDDNDNESLFDEDTRYHILCTANHSEDLVVALLMDRKAGFEDGEGPNYNDAIDLLENDLDSDLTDAELDVMLIGSQACINYLLK